MKAMVLGGRVMHIGQLIYNGAFFRSPCGIEKLRTDVVRFPEKSDVTCKVCQKFMVGKESV